MYNFDKIVDRADTDNVKYDLREAYFGKADVLPMWVADMDFETPDFIGMRSLNEQNIPFMVILSERTAILTSIIKWVERRHNWKLEKDWILFSPGIVPALNMATLTYTKPGDGILSAATCVFSIFQCNKQPQQKTH